MKPDGGGIVVVSVDPVVKVVMSAEQVCQPNPLLMTDISYSTLLWLSQQQTWSQLIWVR